MALVSFPLPGRVHTGAAGSAFMGSGEEREEAERQRKARFQAAVAESRAAGTSLRSGGALEDVDLQELVKEPAQAAPPESDDEEAMEDEQGAQAEGEKKKAAAAAKEEAKQKVDAELERNKAIRRLQKEWGKVDAAVTSGMQSVDAAMMDFSAPKDKSDFSREIAVVKSRSASLRLIAADGPLSSQHLKDHLSRFKIAAADDRTATDDADPDLALSAPCYNFQYLVTMSDLKLKIDIPRTHQSGKAILEVEETQMQSFRAAIELTKAVSKAIAELYNARVHKMGEDNKRKLDLEKEALKRQRRSSGAGEPERSPQQPPMPATVDNRKFWQWTPQAVSRIAVMEENEFVNLQPAWPTISVPIIVNNLSGVLSYKDLADEHPLKKEINSKLDAFRVRTDKSIGQFTAPIEDLGVKSQLKDRIEEILPTKAIVDCALDDAKKKAFEKLIEPDVWIRAPSGDTVNVEPAALASLRVSFAGSRTLVCARFSELGGYVRQQKGARALKQPISMLATVQWLQAASPTDLQARRAPKNPR